jgi:hypothetical protein
VLRSVNGRKGRKEEKRREGDGGGRKRRESGRSGGWTGK